MADPATWGPPVWDAIHFVAAGYPAEPTDANVRAYGAFFRGLADVLPCAPCRANFAEHLQHLPPDAPLAAGRADTFAWTVAFHNAVNASLRKPALTIEDAYARYFHKRVRAPTVAALAAYASVLAVAVAAGFVLARVLQKRVVRLQ